MSFAHRHLLGIEQLSQADITTLLDLADTYADRNRQPNKHSDAPARRRVSRSRASGLARM